ncbi:FAD-dependent monooxygenase [Spirosoma rhododendri]|uniref:FAD-binding monooxygenase n=1 Tax=Spirosoma rhododendri TaxID=2728024 RepID=A0A7L5DU04_9BACT|nr:FAD-dependent monooxygenase [Spirosoma rhododendri]QJD79457.1 FAD-binding monooxygenase [Spirosoma rhododendri]
MPTAATKILISGASIAGPMLAFWLSKYGFDVTVVERAASLRLGGQNIDVNGPARKIIRMMGLEETVRAANTTEIGTQFVNADNEAEATFSKDDPNGLTQELEILRGDLVSILYEASRDKADYRFDDYITGLTQDTNGVDVTFNSGKTERFELVIAADGIRSRTRKLMVGDEPMFNYLGLCTAYLTIPKGPTDTNWARWYTADDRRVILLRPDNKGTTRASFNFLLPQDEYDKLTPADYKPLLKEKIQNAGWEAPRLAREFDTNDDIYFDGVGQIKAPNWSNGRLALTGDAAYCPAPVTGKGTTLAMVGAYVLAGELATHAHYQDAFASYEKRLRPYVESVQKLPPGVPWIVYPKSKLGVFVLNKAFAVAASDAVKKLIGLFSKKDDKHAEEEAEFDLPEYTV